MTAAHRTGPMGSYVTVTSHTNSRSVQVRINDRGLHAEPAKSLTSHTERRREIGMDGTVSVSVQ